MNVKSWSVVKRAVVVRRRTKRRVLRVRVGKKIRKYIEPAESRWFKFTQRRLLRRRYVIFDPSWCDTCRGYRHKNTCVRLVRKFNPGLLRGLDKPCHTPIKHCRFCERNLRGMDDEGAHNHYRWCIREEPGVYIPGMKAYQMIYKRGKEERVKFYDLLKKKKVFKSGSNWYRRV